MNSITSSIERKPAPASSKLPVFIQLVTAILLAAGCSSVPTAHSPGKISTEMVLRGIPLTGQENPEPLDDIDVLALNAKMLAFVNQNVTPEKHKTLKLHKLLSGIINQQTFGLKYDTTTRTASETFDEKLGNCLSFTNMFIAMAREAGLSAQYQEVDIPPDWTRAGDTFILNRHVNVVVDLGQAGEQVVDFNIDDFRTSYDRRTVPDERALAHYYNNLGVERLQDHQNVAALRFFRKAIDSDHQFAPVWSNMGALYSRAGYLEYAEAAYLHALAINPRELVAMSNLGRLYESQGKEQLAKGYNKRANRHRMRNPYFRYHLAREAYLAEDYDIAIGHLKYAVWKKKNEDTFYFLMGLSHLQKGDEATAARWLKKAGQVTEDDGLQRKYHSKLEMLLSAQK